MARLAAILVIVFQLLTTSYVADAEHLQGRRHLAGARAGGLIRTEAELKAGLAGPGPLTIGSSITLTSQLPTVSKYILIQGDAASCRAQAGGWCTLSAKFRFRHFVVANGGHLVLLNLRLKGGWSANSGGSILVASGSRLAVERVFFQYNFAAGKLYGGGAVEVTGRSTFAARDALFVRNAASFGGAIDVAAGSAATLAGCLFHNNTAGLAGGAVSLLAGGAATLSGNTFTRNHASIGGAIYADHSTAAICRGTEFANTAALQGPSVFSGGQSTVSLCEVPLSAVTVRGGGRAAESCALC